jgi:hypothetical protein
MFDVKAPTTIPATLNFVGQGREQKLKVVFRHMPRTQYADLLDLVAKGEVQAEDAVVSLIESWEANAELSAATIKQLSEDQPGADWAILTGYGEALAVARKGN